MVLMLACEYRAVIMLASMQKAVVVEVYRYHPVVVATERGACSVKACNSISIYQQGIRSRKHPLYKVE